jgi:hemerythrin-like domain-containing protein
MATKSSPARKTAKKNSRNAHARNAKDAIALLKQDHELVKEMLGELQQAAGTERDEEHQTQLLAEIEAELKVHTQVEEQIFYPAFRDAAAKREDAKLYFEAVEEHHVVDMVLPEVSDGRPGSPEFAAKVKVLKDLVEHHIEEEEGQMFPKAKKALGKEQLEQLGEQIDRRKSELSEAGAHDRR